MAISDARAQAYLTTFQQQHGLGGMAVFRGLQRYQYGRGFGDIFGGLLRRFLPVVLNIGKAALESLSKSQAQGASIKDALKSTLKPIGDAALLGASKAIDQAQKGQGKRKRKRKSSKKKGKHARKTPIAYNF